VTAQAEYTPDIVAIDFPQSLGILAPRALDYALKIPPLHVLALARLWSFALVLSASIKQYAADRRKLHEIRDE
jgi:hypothetical protein